jgi:hypothetical protein
MMPPWQTPFRGTMHRGGLLTPSNLQKPWGQKGTDRGRKLPPSFSPDAGCWTVITSLPSAEGREQLSLPGPGITKQAEDESNHESATSRSEANATIPRPWVSCYLSAASPAFLFLGSASLCGRKSETCPCSTTLHVRGTAFNQWWWLATARCCTDHRQFRDLTSRPRSHLCRVADALSTKKSVSEPYFPLPLAPPANGIDMSSRSGKHGSEAPQFTGCANLRRRIPRQLTLFPDNDQT